MESLTATPCWWSLCPAAPTDGFRGLTLRAQGQRPGKAGEGERRGMTTTPTLGEGQRTEVFLAAGGAAGACGGGPSRLCRPAGFALSKRQVPAFGLIDTDRCESVIGARFSPRTAGAARAGPRLALLPHNA